MLYCSVTFNIRSSPNCIFHEIIQMLSLTLLILFYLTVSTYLRVCPGPNVIKVLSVYYSALIYECAVGQNNAMPNLNAMDERDNLDTGTNYDYIVLFDVPTALAIIHLLFM